jgi:hypothetical protein
MSLHITVYVELALPLLADHLFMYQRTISVMNQQTSYVKASILEYKKSHESSNSKVLDSSMENIPDVVELARIMVGVISEENARKMTLSDRHAFYNIANGLLTLTYQLS